MPLAKKAPATQPQAATPRAEASAQAATPTTEAQAQTATGTSPAKKLGGLRKPGDKATAPLTKDDYWKRREENDIVNHQHMRRAGAYQAALQSTGLLQLNTGNTLEDYLKLVEQAANHCVAFVERK